MRLAGRQTEACASARLIQAIKRLESDAGDVPVVDAVAGVGPGRHWRLAAQAM